MFTGVMRSYAGCAKSRFLALLSQTGFTLTCPNAARSYAGSVCISVCISSLSFGALEAE